MSASRGLARDMLRSHSTLTRTPRSVTSHEPEDSASTDVSARARQSARLGVGVVGALVALLLGVAAIAVADHLRSVVPGVIVLLVAGAVVGARRAFAGIVGGATLIGLAIAFEVLSPPDPQAGLVIGLGAALAGAFVLGGAVGAIIATLRRSSS